MPPDFRTMTVQRLPLRQLWNAAGFLDATRGSRLGVTEITELLRGGVSALATANIGHPLRWIARSSLFEIWKTELKPRIVPPDAERVRLEDFPGEYAYRASEWRGSDGTVIVVFEMAH